MFEDRAEAGRLLAGPLHHYRGERPVVLGMARGGVVVAYEVARALAAPLDVLVARKIYAPGRPEDAIGAVAPGVTYLDEPLIQHLGVGRRYIELTIEEETRVMEHQERLFHGDRPPLDITGQTVILVDDGVATGATAVAAAEAVRKRRAARVVFAAPVAAQAALPTLKEAADAVVTLETPGPFVAVSACYQDFTPVTDEEVVRALDLVRSGAHGGGHG
jgi:putative phosphoribosyl transferase